MDMEKGETPTATGKTNFHTSFPQLPHRSGTSNRLALLLLDAGNDVWLSAYIAQTFGGGGYYWQSPKYLDTGVASDLTRCIDGDWAPQNTEFWVFAGDGQGDDLSYKVFDINYGTLSEYVNSWNQWFTYSYTSLGAKQWVQARAVPYIGTPEFFITTLDENNELMITNIPADATIGDSTSFSTFEATAGSATTGLSSYESFDVAWTRYAQ